MDFVYLVNSGRYSTDDIKSARARGFIEGMEFVLHTDVENFLANYFITTDPDELSTLDRIQYDIVEEAIEELKDIIQGSICESIVIFCDDEAEAEAEE